MRGESGFTLLELLISMTILSLLLTVVFGGLTFGARAWEQTLQSTASALDIKTAQAFLRSSLGRAYPHYVVKEPGRAYVDFQGTTERMSFLAPPPQVFSDGGRARFELRRSGEAGRQGLLLTLRPELHGTGPNLAEETLVDNAASVSFAYFGSTGAGEPEVWRDSWENRHTLPALIRIRAAFAEGDTRSWPELIIAPHVTVDVSCNFDPLTKYCTGR
jgi:general secretion pathway protein J